MRTVAERLSQELKKIDRPGDFSSAAAPRPCCPGWRSRAWGRSACLSPPARHGS